jgi:hypothetical protein
MYVAVGWGTKRIVEGACMNDRLTSTAGKMRHRAAAPLAEGGCKTPSLRQVETSDRSLAAKPAAADAFTITSQEWAVPVAFRQREQWQFRKRSKGPSTSNPTSPQMQLPRHAAILTSLSIEEGL